MRAMLDRSKPEDFGANSWLVEEMYERFREDPNSVGDTWKEFFSDFKPAGAPKVDSTAEIIRPALPPELREEGAKSQPVVTSPGVEPPAPKITASEIIPDG